MKYMADERGGIAAVASIVLLSLLLIGALSFGVWAFTSRQDYKANVDKKIAVAVQQNTKVVQAKDAEDYAEAAKLPLKTYTGPDAYGSIQMQYPKTWSAYVVSAASGSSGQPLDIYAQPDVVPSVSDQKSVFALRLQVVSTAYSQTVAQFQNLQKSGKVSVTPYTLPKNPEIVGVRVDGQLTSTKQGSIIILPLRDKSLKVWTESGDYLNDFNNNILPNLSFSP